MRNSSHRRLSFLCCIFTFLLWLYIPECDGAKKGSRASRLAASTSDDDDSVAPSSPYSRPRGGHKQRLRAAAKHDVDAEGSTSSSSVVDNAFLKDLRKRWAKVN